LPSSRADHDKLRQIAAELADTAALPLRSGLGAGSGVSVATAALADPTMLGAIDIAATVPWLQVATLCIGLLTGVSSLALVLMKVVQQAATCAAKRR
jgi:hypothetical protein